MKLLYVLTFKEKESGNKINIVIIFGLAFLWEMDSLSLNCVCESSLAYSRLPVFILVTQLQSF